MWQTGTGDIIAQEDLAGAISSAVAQALNLSTQPSGAVTITANAYNVTVSDFTARQIFSAQRIEDQPEAGA